LQGAQVANMSPALADELDLGLFFDGVFILAIKRGSPANRLGFQRGDIVRSVNGKNTPNVKKLIKVLGQTVERWRISVERAGKMRDLVINR